MGLACFSRRYFHLFRSIAEVEQLYLKVLQLRLDPLDRVAVTFQGAALERVFKRTIKLGRFKDEPNI
jgi:hypothetical protein